MANQKQKTKLNKKGRHQPLDVAADKRLLSLGRISDKDLKPNMRALRLAMTVGDILLSMGVPTSRVVSRCLDITEAYCKLPVHVDISANTIILSQIRGVDKEPLTMMRPVTEREVNNMTIQQIQHMVFEVRTGKLTLRQAEIKLDKFLKNPPSYPSWLTTTGGALIASGVTLIYGGSWRIMLVSFIISTLVINILDWLRDRGITAFFRISAAAIVVTLAAALVQQFDRAGVTFFGGMNPTLIVVGGIIMLLSGLMIVGAASDALDEFYVTANARTLRVFIQTMGIVTGILIGIYLSRRIGFGISISPDPLGYNDSTSLYVLGGGIAAAGYALHTRTRLRAIVWAGLIGAISLSTALLVRSLDISVVAGGGVAAIMVGLLATTFSRRWRTPSTGIITAGILPLAPGLSLYIALMQIANYPPGDDMFAHGLGTLFTAISTALAVAVGASLGSVLSRPFSQRLTYIRNTQPFLAFMRIQLKPNRGKDLATLILSQLRIIRPVPDQDDEVT